jgi:Icc-related predicted phosphoesterase
MGRIIDIKEGKLLIATDIHGNWKDYRSVRDLYETLRNRGKADFLVLNGDLIHGYPGYEDRSVEILDDLIGNPDESLIALMGNHELPHVYHFEVLKGSVSFVEPMERRIENRRERYTGFIEQMAYAVRTPGGVLINHSGPNYPMAGFSKRGYEAFVRNHDLFRVMDSLDHDAVRQQLEKKVRETLEKEQGERLPDGFFDAFREELGYEFLETEVGRFLWDVFFNKNEHEFGMKFYKAVLEGFLQTMSSGGKPQKFLVSGHIEVRKGYEVIGGKQLRICSSQGARDSKKVLSLVDASRQYQSINDLVHDLVLLYA